MSITIEQTKEQVADSFELNRHVYLRSIRMAKSSLWSESISMLEGVHGPLESRIDFNPAEVKKLDSVLLLNTTFKFNVYAASASPAREVVRIECQFEAEYGLASGYTPAEGHIKAFHEGNAIFNCWPYFREYVQSSAVRMNYPPPPVPLLRLIPGTKSTSGDDVTPQKLPGRTTKRKRKVQNRRTQPVR